MSPIEGPVGQGSGSIQGQPSRLPRPRIGENAVPGVGEDGSARREGLVGRRRGGSCRGLMLVA